MEFVKAFTTANDPDNQILLETKQFVVPTGNEVKVSVLGAKDGANYKEAEL